jgi:hypothetical protein
VTVAVVMRISVVCMHVAGAKTWPHTPLFLRTYGRFRGESS